MTGRALRAANLDNAGRIAAATGARLLSQTSNARVERGAGRVAVDRVPYPVDIALKFLAGLNADRARDDVEVRQGGFDPC